MCANRDVTILTFATVSGACVPDLEPSNRGGISMKSYRWRATAFALAWLTGIAPVTAAPIVAPIGVSAEIRERSTGSALPPAVSEDGAVLLVQWPPPPPPGWGGGPPPPPPPGWRPPPPPPTPGLGPPPPAPLWRPLPPPPPVWGSSSAHVRWCMNRYRSYNPRTDTYLGFDGRYHRCRSPYR